MELSLNSKVRVNSEILSREVDGEMVILDLSENAYFGLNEVGTLIWQSLQSGMALQEIASKITEEYEVESDEASRDLLNVLGELQSKGMVLVQ